MQVKFTLTATQADVLEDALLTFQPSAGCTINTSGHKYDGEGTNLRYAVHITPDQLPQAVIALESYHTEIFPKSRMVARLLKLLKSQAVTRLLRFIAETEDSNPQQTGGAA